jgi:N-methylhydantoinase B/oxoprolinase/acetone carboxylase alpha subunit
MAFAVKSQIQRWQGKLKDGDVLLSNSPGKHSTSFQRIPGLTCLAQPSAERIYRT